MTIRRGAIPQRFRSDMSLQDAHEYLSRPSRRRFLQGTAAAAGLAVAAPSVFIKSARAAGAAPAGGHLAFGADPRREMSVVWSTPGPVDRPRVTFGPGDADGTTVAAETRVVPTNLVDPLRPAERHYHQVRLTGLDPDTVYAYRIQHDGAETAPRPFATAPDGAGAFSFTAFGDQGVSGAARSVVAQLASIRPAFNLVAGDLCYANSRGFTIPTDIVEFDPAEWDGWFAQANPSAASTPWMPAMGNHDVEPGFGENGYEGHRARLALPTGGFSNVTYSFRYGNVAVIALDANDVSSEIPHPYSSGGQTAWLDTELRRLRADPTIDFIVAFFHHCAYCTITSHGSDGGVRRSWVPLFDRYQVDLVVNGHNHGYERTTPIRGGVPTVDAPTGATVHPADHGTTYICAGGGGKAPNELGRPGEGFVSNGPGAHDNPVTGEPEAAPWSVKAVADNGFLRVDVAPPAADGTTTMTLTAVDLDGNAFDRVVLARRHARPAVEGGGGIPPSAAPTAPTAPESDPLPATGRGSDLWLPAGAAAAGLVAAAGVRAAVPSGTGDSG